MSTDASLAAAAAAARLQDPFIHAGGASQATQVLLRLQYQDRLRRGELPSLADVEFRCYSQNGEDGILPFLFALIGSSSRRAVEICAGSGVECNAANLVVNHGWRALLVDGDPQNIALGTQFYQSCKNTALSLPTLVPAWITAETVNGLVQECGLAGDIRLLSLDLDGVDHWIWRALDCVRTDVVVVEFNALLGPQRRLTVPYDPPFRLDLSQLPYRCGASLPAFAALARDKGYRLVGVQSLGFNAFFVRDGLLDQVLVERTPAECYASCERLREWNEGWYQMMLKDGQRWDEV